MEEQVIQETPVVSSEQPVAETTGTINIVDAAAYEQQIQALFSMEIENIAKEKGLTHMEAILWYCKREEIEPDTVSNLITKSLKEKVEANARELNFLPRQAQLPI